MIAWNVGFWLLLICAALAFRLRRAEQAIRAHRDVRGDDRCWRDDETLYEVLPEGFRSQELDSAVELERCKQYILCRHNPHTVYVSPQRRIELLCLLQHYVGHDLECIGNDETCSCGLTQALDDAGLKDGARG